MQEYSLLVNSNKTLINAHKKVTHTKKIRINRAIVNKGMENFDIMLIRPDTDNLGISILSRLLNHRILIKSNENFIL